LKISNNNTFDRPKSIDINKKKFKNKKIYI